MSTVALTDVEAKNVIAENISSLLDELGMSQKELADLSGENEMAISRMVRGVQIPSAARLARVAEALRVTVDALLTKSRKARVSS